MIKDGNDIKVISTLIAVASSATYLLGIIVVNSYLLPFGFTDFDVFSARYILPGLLFVLFLLTFYFFCGRNVVSIHKTLERDMYRAAQYKNASFWNLFIFVTSFSRILFLMICGVTLFSSLVLTEAVPGEYWLYMLMAFGISYTIDIKNFDISHWRISYPVERLIEIFGIVVFFGCLPSNSTLMKIFLIFFGAAIVLNFILDSRDRYKIDLNKQLYDAFFVSFYVVTMSVSFGLVVYGKSLPSIGGGAPVPAILYFSRDVPESLVSEALVSNGTLRSVAASIIVSTDRFTIISPLSNSEVVVKVPTALIDFTSIAIADVPARPNLGTEMSSAHIRILLWLNDLIFNGEAIPEPIKRELERHRR